MRLVRDEIASIPAAGSAWLNEAVLVTAVTTGAFILRLYFMRYHPVMVPDYDGAEYLLLGGGVFSGRPYYTSFIPPGFPLLLGFALPFFRDPQRAGMVVSALFGSGLCAAVYLFTRELFNRKTALTAAVMTACLGQLITASTWVMSEMPFAFFLYMGLYAASVFTRRGGWLSAAAAGGLFGAAYLVRPDAAPVFVLWMLLAGWICGRRGVRIREMALGIGAGAAIFVIMASPYIVYLKGALGGWSISGKLGYNLSVTKGADWNGGVLGYFMANIGQLAAKYQHNFRKLAELFAGGFGLPLSLVAATGMAASAFWLKGRPLGLFYPALVVAYLLVLPFFVVDERMVGPYYPAALVWAAAGVTYAEDRLKSSPGLVTARRLSGVTVAALAVFCAFQGLKLMEHYGSKSFVSMTEGLREQYLETGDWIRHNTAPGDRIMSKELLNVFYGGREYVQLPDVPPDELARLAREEGVRYVVVDTACVFKRKALRPLLLPFIGADTNVPGFVEV